LSGVIPEKNAQAIGIESYVLQPVLKNQFVKSVGTALDQGKEK
jgi:hypothetical protein